MLSIGQLTATMDRPNPFAALFEEIAEVARTALRRSSYFELRNVACSFSGGVLTLQGRVSSYHMKQIAQASVADVPGVIEIHNRLEVVSPRPAHDTAGIASRPPRNEPVGH
jgi:hypothetical protein